MFESLKLNVVVTLASVDALLTTIALLRVTRSRPLLLVKTTALPFGLRLKQPGQRVAVIGTIFEREEAELHRQFVRQLREDDHELVALISPHNEHEWRELCDAYQLPWPKLAVDSSTGGSCGSSLHLQLEQQGGAIDPVVSELLRDADASTRSDWTGRFSWIVNAIFKTRGNDVQRLTTLVWWFKHHDEPNQQLLDWAARYREVEAVTEAIVSRAVALGDAISRVDLTPFGHVDLAAIRGQLYRLGAQVIVFVRLVSGQRVVQFDTRNEALDLRSIAKRAGFDWIKGRRSCLTVSEADGDAMIDTLHRVIGVQTGSATDQIRLLRERFDGPGRGTHG